jgi:hypothetical protein
LKYFKNPVGLPFGSLRLLLRSSQDDGLKDNFVDLLGGGYADAVAIKFFVGIDDFNNRFTSSFKCYIVVVELNRYLAKTYLLGARPLIKR